MFRFIQCCCIGTIASITSLTPCVCMGQEMDRTRDDAMPRSYRVQEAVVDGGISSPLDLFQPKSTHFQHVNQVKTNFARGLDWGHSGALRGYLLSGWAGQVVRRGSARLSPHTARTVGADASLSSREASSSTARAPRNAVYIRLSASFLRRLANQSLDQRAPLVDEILGATVEGTSHTTARTELTLLPDAQRGRTVLRVVGTTSFDVAGRRGQVDIGTQGVTQFHAEKSLLLDGDKLRTTPTRIRAHTRLTVARTSTRMPGLRGLVVQGIAERRMAKRRSEAEHVSARHTERRIARQIDQWVDRQLVALVSPLTDMASMFPRGSSRLPKELRSSTTRELLEVIVIAPADPGGEMATAPALQPGDTDVTVHLHSALVRQLLSDPELRPMIQAFSETMLSLAGSAAIGASPPTLGSIPMDSVRWSKNGEWITLNLAVGPRPSSRKASKAR